MLWHEQLKQYVPLLIVRHLSGRRREVPGNLPCGYSLPLLILQRPPLNDQFHMETRSKLLQQHCSYD